VNTLPLAQQRRYGDFIGRLEADFVVVVIAALGEQRRHTFRYVQVSIAPWR